jgi:ribonuclease HII
MAKRCKTTTELFYPETDVKQEDGKPFGPEIQFWADSFPIVIGTDEAGRGPLAGPVVAAAVVFDENVIIDGIGDSKKLTEKHREKLFDQIIEKSLAYAIVEKSSKRICEINILQATREAMDEAVISVADKMNSDHPIVLVDGRIPQLSIGRHLNIIKGDSKSFTIGAASILAKVYRDRLMKEMDNKYKGYDFAKHKGYGTKVHRNAIFKLGPCKLHRSYFTLTDLNGKRVAIGDIKPAKTR